MYTYKYKRHLLTANTIENAHERNYISNKTLYGPGLGWNKNSSNLLTQYIYDAYIVFHFYFTAVKQGPRILFFGWF